MIEHKTILLKQLHEQGNKAVLLANKTDDDNDDDDDDDDCPFAL